MSCNCGDQPYPGWPTNQPYPEGYYQGRFGCNASIPACPPRLAPQIPISIQLNELEQNLFGAASVQVLNGRPIWVAACGLGAQIWQYARNPGEGFICYLIRILNILFNGNAPGGFACQIFSAADLINTPTANGQKVAGYSVIPTMNVITPNMLGFYRLIPGNGGGVIPYDYNASTNNVSWQHVL